MLIPREHGAYGQLLFPLLSALLIGHPAPGAYLLGAAAVAAFLAHESLLVVLGQRGSRAAREQRSAARRSLGLFGGFGFVTGLVALVVLPRGALLSLLLPMVLAALVGAAVVMHRERTSSGEVLAAVALSSVSVPVALAGGVPLAGALTIFLVFASVFVTATVAVRAMIARVIRKDGPSPAGAAALTLALIAALAISAATGRLSPVAPYAALPVCAIALGLTARPPAPRHLRADRLDACRSHRADGDYSRRCSGVAAPLARVMCREGLTVRQPIRYHGPSGAAVDTAPGRPTQYSSVAQRQSIRLLTGGLLVRIQPEEPSSSF